MRLAMHSAGAVMTSLSPNHPQPPQCARACNTRIFALVLGYFHSDEVTPRVQHAESQTVASKQPDSAVHGCKVDSSNPMDTAELLQLGTLTAAACIRSSSHFGLLPRHRHTVHPAKTNALPYDDLQFAVERTCAVTWSVACCTHTQRGGTELLSGPTIKSSQRTSG